MQVLFAYSCGVQLSSSFIQRTEGYILLTIASQDSWSFRWHYAVTIENPDCSNWDSSLHFSPAPSHFCYYPIQQVVWFGIFQWIEVSKTLSILDLIFNLALTLPDSMSSIIRSSHLADDHTMYRWPETSSEAKEPDSLWKSIDLIFNRAGSGKIDSTSNPLRSRCLKPAE